MFIFIAIPLFVAAIMPLVGKISKRVLPDILANLTFLFMACYTVFAGRNIIASGPVLSQISWFGEHTGITMSMDSLSLLMLLMIAIVSLAVSIYSIGYMEKYGSKPAFYSLMLLMVTGMNGLVITTDLFGIYLFLEVAALASYGLACFGRSIEELEGTYKYLMLSVIASSFILLSISLIFAITGSTRMIDVALAMKTLNWRTMLVICGSLFIVGFGLKSALVPFHSWLPDAYTASPATLPALSSGLLIKISGVYAMVRIFYNIFGMSTPISTVLLYLGMVSMVVGALIAIGQNDIRRMLGYSSISQMGYVVAGLSLGTPLGIIGGLFHLFNHGLFKSLLFMTSGAIESQTGTRELHKMAGLSGKKMPITAGTNLIGALATAGVPPLNGFWSKLIIIIALVQADRLSFAVIAILISVVTLWYFLILQRRTFFSKLSDTWKNVKDPSGWMSVANILLALLCIIIGILFPIFISIWVEPVTKVLAAGINYAAQFLKM
jgi:multicomponent Na+:H+ antiporter subunit D